MKQLVAHRIQLDGRSARVKFNKLYQYVRDLDDYDKVVRKFIQIECNDWNSVEHDTVAQFGYKLILPDPDRVAETRFEKTESERAAMICEIWQDMIELDYQDKMSDGVDIFVISNSPAMRTLAASLHDQFDDAVTLYAFTARPESMGGFVESIDVRLQAILQEIC